MAPSAKKEAAVITKPIHKPTDSKCPYSADQVKDAIKSASKDDDRMYSILMAMAEKETHFRPCDMGDLKNGVYRSAGAFQIQFKLHGVSKSDAINPKFSAEWTRDNLIKNGYSNGYVKIAVKKHNGWGSKAEAYALDVLSKSRKYVKSS